MKKILVLIFLFAAFGSDGFGRRNVQEEHNEMDCIDYRIGCRVGRLCGSDFGEIA
jgi:hypothetical protein